MTRELDAAHWGSLFASPLLEHVWAEAGALNDALRDSILQHAAAHPGEERSNLGGWHSETGGLEFCGAAGERLIQWIGAMTEEATFRLYRQYGRPQEALNWSLSAWANVNQPGHGNNVHTHPGATWSGVYYVDDGGTDGAGEATAIQFADPNPVRTNLFFPDLLNAALRFQPRPGLMILFPSYLPHSVPAHRGTRARISVAFNVRKDPFP